MMALRSAVILNVATAANANRWADAALTPRAKAEWLGQPNGASVDAELPALNER
jgi:hypothetical protein